MASFNTAGRPKRNLRNFSDGPRFLLPTPPASAFEGLIMASTSSPQSSFGKNHLSYDIFINHYGQDTKFTLANSIYKKLDATGLRVFLDQHELELGEFFPKALEEVIGTASLHLAIFSKNYAKSPWCLAELSLILQTNVTFIPIFYHVEPYVLRWAIEGKGIYADAFDDYEKKNRYGEKLQSWKNALHEASFYSGKIIDSQCNEEAAVINVVNHVLKKLKKVKYEVAKHAVGLDELEEDFHNKIALQPVSGAIQIMGIWGMGGSGKTTLAKHLYNKNCSFFERSSFLFDVREAARKDLLHKKQKELLHDLDLDLESKSIKSIEQGKEILRSRLRSVSVLIVIDDVDHTKQLDALLPGRDSLGHGSLVIITTRDRRVLTAQRISPIYKMPTLNPSHAHQLFCCHAFGQPSPLTKFKQLAQKFTDACHGLPLSLEVLGSQLYGESSLTYWQSQFDKFSRIMPADIKLRLKLSYDALDKEEKEMFLDVACFFDGWARSEAITTWDGSGWNGLHGLQMLVNKCFVDLDEKDDAMKIRMHEHFRDLGREIANEHLLYRLWSKDQIIEIQPQQEAIQIRGILADAFGDNCYMCHGKIILNTSQGKRILAPSSLGLKIFIGEGDFINEECSELSRELLCFRCDRFAHRNLPSWLPLKKLRILELAEPQKLEDLWECDEDAPLQLRQLIIHEGYELKKISGLQRLKSLETLIVNNCTELNTIPSLAETSLKMFAVSGCNKLKKIGSLESLTSLETCIIYDCNKLNTLPSLTEATSLKEIDLRDCNKLKKIESLESLRSLETLRIYDCTELNTLPSLAETTSLKEIDLSGCIKLKKIESLESLRSLERLTIADCIELNTLPSLSEATSLKEIDLFGCNKLEKIESLESLRSLETLKIYYCTDLNTLPSLVEATSLKEIDLRNCNKLEKIESLESLTSLETLKIYYCTDLNTLPSLVEATSLKEIDLRDCHKLKKIESLERLRSLQTFRIYDCTELNTLPSLTGATSLKEIKLKGCSKLEKIEYLENLRSLEKFKIYDCTKLNTLPSLADATSLKEIDLSGCSKLERIESLEGLRSLKTLRIYDCTELVTLPSLIEATSLKKFDLRCCDKLEKIENVECLRSLETVIIYDCPALDTLPQIGKDRRFR